MNSFDCTVSVVILTKNAGPSFKRTLDQISAQKLNGSHELIVVDSGSTDGTLDLVRNYKAQVYVIRPEEFNFGHTRNYGFSLARGEFIVTLSQDVVPCDELWLERLIAPFSDGDAIAAVQGAEALPSQADVFFWERTGDFYYTRECCRWVERYKTGLSFVNCAVRQSFWQSHQLPPLPFSEDKYFEKVIHEGGCRVATAKDARCFHGHQYSVKGLILRLIGEGRGWAASGERYDFADVLSDLLRARWLFAKAFDGVRQGRIRHVSEWLFPILRPLCIYIGNRMVR